jgi:serine/threonine-protein kinase HipA
MKNNEKLNVWYNKTLVGQLWHDQTNMIGFVYDDNWLTNGFAISQQLPLSENEYSPHEGKAHRYFANLLPEAGAREHIIRELKIVNTDYELLKAIGGECAGAVSILPHDHEPTIENDYMKLSNDKLKQLLQRKNGIFNLTTQKKRPRLSLAGAQDKCPVFYDGKDFYLPQNSSASSHIIKFEISGYRHIPAYEFFMTKLAGKIGLPVVDCELHSRNNSYFLVVKRYDRIIEEEQTIKRLHQEDLCQALGYSYNKKYQYDGGPTFSDCYKLIQNISSQPIIDNENLLKWQIFNVLAGNSDGHAKNLAIIYDNNFQTRLTPFYDLVCTRAIEHIDTNLALSVGGVFNPNLITLKGWTKFAEDCNIRLPYLLSTVREIAEGLLGQTLSVKQEFAETHGPNPALQRIEYIIMKQCKKVITELKK